MSRTRMTVRLAAAGVLDSVADKLESVGNFKLALAVDRVSDKLAGSREMRVAVTRDGCNTVSINNSNGSQFYIDFPSKETSDAFLEALYEKKDPKLTAHSTASDFTRVARKFQGKVLPGMGMDVQTKKNLEDKKWDMLYNPFPDVRPREAAAGEGSFLRSKYDSNSR